MVQNVFIITPAYNAAATVERVFERFPSEVRRRVREFVVVDDGSTDGTREVLERVRREYANVVNLRHERNRGYGEAEKTLLDYAVGAGAEVMILVHADGQYSPESVPEVLDLFDRDDADLVQGSRMLDGGALRGGMPLHKYLGNRGLTFLENLAFGMRMAEFHSGFMSYNRRFVTSVPYRKLSGSFDFDLEMILAARILGFRIREVAIPTIYGDEVSHLNPVKYGFDVLKIVRRYRGGFYHKLLGA